MWIALFTIATAAAVVLSVAAVVLQSAQPGEFQG
jgi:hypothetical protein